MLGAHLLDGPNILIASAERVAPWLAQARWIDFFFSHTSGLPLFKQKLKQAMAGFNRDRKIIFYIEILLPCLRKDLFGTDYVSNALAVKK